MPRIEHCSLNACACDDTTAACILDGTAGTRRLLVVSRTLYGLRAQCLVCLMALVSEVAPSIRTIVLTPCHSSTKQMQSTQTKSSCPHRHWTGWVGSSSNTHLISFVVISTSFVCAAASLHIEYPMLFKVENRKTGRSTHCGVLEFTADEGHVYLPYWVGSSSKLVLHGHG